MIVQANRVYDIRYGGKVHQIKRKDLTRLNNRLADSWKRATPNQKRSLQRILIELNGKYIRQSSYRFQNPMEMEDWIQECYRALPQALNAYQLHLGNFMQYFVAWKRAAFNEWMDKKDTVSIPHNQRLTLNKSAESGRRSMPEKSWTKRRKRLLKIPASGTSK